jgi:trimethylamine:corrinoid methyltransferase-like protein
MHAVNTAKKSFTVRARNPRYDVRMNTEELYVTPGYGSPYICEADGTQRTATLEDFLTLVMLVQQSDVFSINGGILVQPGDVDPDIAAETMVYATLCRSDKALFSVCNGKRQAENILELLRLSFGGELPPDPVSFHLISTLSPLAIGGNAIDTSRVFAPAGFACRSGGGMSDAGGLTAQAGAETAMNLFESFSQKANLVMHAAGSLNSFNAVSVEKFVFDMEIIDRMRWYFRDLDVSEDALAFDVIRDVVAGESFILHDHTLERCRTDQWISTVSLHGSAKGEPNTELYDSIRRQIDKMLSGWRRPPMESSVRHRLDETMRSLGLAEAYIAKI